jgi:hypothetical protein
MPIKEQPTCGCPDFVLWSQCVCPADQPGLRKRHPYACLRYHVVLFVFQNCSISSSVRPLVSGMYFRTKKKANTLIAP